MTDGDGKPVTLQDFAGQVVLLNFWATWCAPCVREMPSLDRLQAKLGGEGLAVVTVSRDRGGANVVMPFYERLELTNLGVYLDPKGAFSRAFKVRGLPTTILIDREGRVVGERLFTGLFTSTAYARSPDQIPILRRKLSRVIAAAGAGSCPCGGSLY